MRTAWVGLGAALVSISCGGEPPAVVAPPPLHVTAKPPEPARARWVFARAGEGIRSKLDLGGDGVLYVGESGRRELAKGGALTDAATLAPCDLVGVVRDGARFVFVGADGSTWVASEPLGAIDPLHARVAGATAIATGKKAILAVAAGKLLRSSDFGATWSPVAYAGASAPYGGAGWVALDSKGNGVLVHFPQRLFVTHDDGETWAPLASVRTGARDVVRDGDDRVVVLGFGGGAARLEGNALVATDDPPKPMREGAPATELATPERRSRTLLAGDHVVELRVEGSGAGRAVTVGSAPLGQKIEHTTVAPELLTKDGLSDAIDAYGRDVVYLKSNDDDDAKGETTIFRSHDRGATWQKDAQLPGDMLGLVGGPQVAAGPDGWTYVTTLCQHGDPFGAACAPPKIRAAGAKTFENVETFKPTLFAFDEAHHKVYAVGETDGRRHVYVSPLDRVAFVATAILDAPAYTMTRLAIDAKGTVHAFVVDTMQHVIQVTRGDEHTDRAPTPQYLALPVGTMAFAGSRGMLFSLAEAYETDDAGETWTRVATNGPASWPACSEAGCINGDAQRVGWDLPGAHGAIVRVQAERPKRDDETPPPPAAPVTHVSCTASASVATVRTPPGEEMVDGVGATRWATTAWHDDGSIGVRFATKATTRELPLLGPPPKRAAGAPALDVRTSQSLLEDGVVVARYAFAPRGASGQYNPVDVDLAWWSASTGRAHRRAIPKVKPFRVGRRAFSGTASIVDGGVVFQGAPNDAAYFVHDDGKLDRVELPSGAIQRQIARVGGHWAVLDFDDGVVRISTSDDGKSWSQTAWGLGPVSHVALSHDGARATVWAEPDRSRAMAFDVAAPLSNDPPAPRVVDLAPAGACDANAGARRLAVFTLPGEPSPLALRVATPTTADYRGSVRVLHDAARDKTCDSAYVFDGTEPFDVAFVYPEASGAATGWRFREAGARGYLVEPLACKVSP